MTRSRLLLAREPKPAPPSSRRVGAKRPKPAHVQMEDGERPLAVCLFAGPGGETEGEAQASESAGLVMGRDYDYIAINHDAHCVETLRLNHPKATILHDDIEKLDPRKILLNPKTQKLRRVARLTGSPMCKGYSRAAGGRPRSRQLRASVFYILKWIRWGRPHWGCFENVPEFLKTREYQQLLRGIESLRKVGLHYRIEARVIDAANLGGAQHRIRAFIQIAIDYGPISWPKETHSNPERPAPGTQPWVGADTILDLDAPTRSIYGRGLVPNTLQRYARGMRDIWGSFWGEPLAETIDAYLNAYGEAWWPALAKCINMGMDTPQAEALARRVASAHAEKAPGWGPVPLRRFLERAPRTAWPREFREFPVRLRLQDGEVRAAIATIAPLMLGQNGGAEARPATRPVSTMLTAGFTRVMSAEFVLPALGRFANGGKSNPPQPATAPLNTLVAGKESAYVAQLVLEPFLLPRHREREGQAPRYHDARAPLPTVACSAEPALAGAELHMPEPIVVQWHAERPGDAPRCKSTRQPLPTVTTSDDRAIGECVLVIMYNGNGQVLPVGQPLPAVTCVERHALGEVLLEVNADDVLVHPTLRSILVREAARAQGFRDSYEFSGGRRHVMRQIGDAVHVNVSRALYTCGLTGAGVRDARLTDYAGGAGA